MARPEKSKKIEEGNDAQSAASNIDESDNIQSDIEQPALESPTAEQSPTLEQIEMRAYEIYLERGGSDGSDTDDWLRAERELRGTDGDQDISQ
jgi:hypothetical protein